MRGVWCVTNFIIFGSQSKEQRAKSKEQRAKSKEQRAKSKEGAKGKNNERVEKCVMDGWTKECMVLFYYASCVSTGTCTKKNRLIDIVRGGQLLKSNLIFFLSEPSPFIFLVQS